MTQSTTHPPHATTPAGDRDVRSSAERLPSSEGKEHSAEAAGAVGGTASPSGAAAPSGAASISGAPASFPITSTPGALPHMAAAEQVYGPRGQSALSHTMEQHIAGTDSDGFLLLNRVATEPPAHLDAMTESHHKDTAVYKALLFPDRGMEHNDAATRRVLTSQTTSSAAFLGTCTGIDTHDSKMLTDVGGDHDNEKYIVRRTEEGVSVGAVKEAVSETRDTVVPFLEAGVAGGVAATLCDGQREALALTELCGSSCPLGELQENQDMQRIEGRALNQLQEDLKGLESRVADLRRLIAAAKSSGDKEEAARLTEQRTQLNRVEIPRMIREQFFCLEHMLGPSRPWTRPSFQGASQGEGEGEGEDKGEGKGEGEGEAKAAELEGQDAGNMFEGVRRLDCAIAVGEETIAAFRERAGALTALIGALVQKYRDALASLAKDHTTLLSKVAVVAQAHEENMADRQEEESDYLYRVNVLGMMRSLLMGLDDCTVTESEVRAALREEDRARYLPMISGAMSFVRILRQIDAIDGEERNEEVKFRDSLTLRQSQQDQYRRLVVGSAANADPHAYTFLAGSRDETINAAAKVFSDGIVADNMEALAEELNMHGAVANGFDPEGNPVYTKALLDAAMEACNRQSDVLGGVGAPLEGCDSLVGRTLLLHGSVDHPEERNKVAPTYLRSLKAAEKQAEQTALVLKTLGSILELRLRDLKEWRVAALKAVFEECRSLMNDAHNQQIDNICHVWEYERQIKHNQTKIGMLQRGRAGGGGSGTGRCGLGGSSFANTRAVDTLETQIEDWKEEMRPYVEDARFYGGIFDRLAHPDHDFSTRFATAEKDVETYRNTFNLLKVEAEARLLVPPGPNPLPPVTPFPLLLGNAE